MKAQKWLGNDAGITDTMMMFIFAIMMILGVGVGTFVQVYRIGKVDSILQEAANRVADSIRANGCVTIDAQSDLSNYLTENSIDPSQVYFNASTSREGYGSTASNGSLGYNFEIKIPYLDLPVFKLYREKPIPNVQSEYVGGMSSDTSGCSGTFSSFGGVQTSSTDLGPTPITGTTNPTVPNLITLTGPSSVTVGQSASFSGTVSMGTGTAPAGTQVTLSTPNGLMAVSTQANGTFTSSISFPNVGTQTITATSGVASASRTVIVNASAPASITFTNAQ